MIQTSLSGLNAASIRAGVAANNIANMGSVGAIKPENGKAAYTPQDVIATSNPTGGVIATVQPRDPSTVSAYSPDSPFSDPETGLIAVPNVDLVDELMQLKMAEIAYKSNAAVLKTASQMQDELIQTVDKRV